LAGFPAITEGLLGTAKSVLLIYWNWSIFLSVAETSFDNLLSDEEMRSRLMGRETLFFRQLGSQWQEIEKQIDRLGFGESYFVTQLSARRGQFTKVTPVSAQRTQEVALSR
jgi:hypothetical protein